MNQLTIFDVGNSIDKVSHTPIPVYEITKDFVSRKTTELISSSSNGYKKTGFSFENFSGYEFEIDNGNIRRILFRFGEESFMVNLDYNYYIKKDIIRNYYSPEDNIENQELIFTNFRILSLQKKVNSGYSEKISGANSLTYGINLNKLILFVKKFLESQHLYN